MTYPPISFARLLLALCLCLTSFVALSQTTSWRGTTSAAWANSNNWTNGVPTSTVDAVVGDASFTGTFQPSVTATANCRALTIGGGSRMIQLTVNALLNVFGNLNVTTLGTLRHTGNSVSIRGNWSLTGTYTPTVNTATVVFSGTTQAINNATTFRRVTINSGSTTALGANISITNAFVVSGIFDPSNSTNLVTLTGSTFTVNALGRVRVHAGLFSGNYSINPTTLNATSIVEYASASIGQTIATLNYGTLTITGGSVKTLAANTTMQSASNGAGNVNVNAGTLNLGTFTLNRNAGGGGTFVVSNGAQLTIGGSNAFPANYNTTTLGATSTVVYGGANQTVTSKTYGHLVLTGSVGSVVKTFPAGAITIAGNLTSTVGTATAVGFTAGGALTIGGNVSIGASTTFNGGASTHILTGNWANAGTFNGNTGTIRINGATRVISGGGVQNFNNLTLAGSGITCSSTNVTLTGNLSTTGGGTFTHNAGGTITFTGATKTITGTGHSLQNVVISGSVSTTASFPIGGNITTNGTFNATAGTITFSAASAVIGGTGTTTFFGVVASGALSAAINFSMRSALSGPGKLTATAGTITFIGNTTVTGAHDLFNATLNGTRLQLGANSTLSIAGTFTVSSGTFNTAATTPNTFIYNGPGNQNIVATTYNNLILANGGTKTALGNTTTQSSLTINPGVTFNAASSTQTISGSWVNNGTFTPATSTVTFNGATNGALTGATTFNNITMNKSTAATNVTLNNNVTTNNITMTNGRMLTGSNAITITGTRTGNAVILGTITRTHAFAANTSYAFESNQNTINFTNITGGSVTSVTVNVTSAPVGDFPNNSITRTYNVSVTKTGSYLATLRLHYDDTELNGNVEANLGMWRNIAGVWTGLGRSSNDAVNNWVQLTTQADITNRWTLFDGSLSNIWKGTTSTAWATASNWKSGVVPAANDNVFIGTETFTNQPSITTAITARSIVFGSAKAVNLTIGGASGALVVNGNVTGDWTADQSHVINLGARTLTVGGDLTLSNGGAGRSMQLNLSTGVCSVTGSVNQSGAGAIVFSGNGILNIGTDFNYSAGTFTAGTGTVMYNGGADQVIASGLTYNNLTFIKASGNANLSGASTVNGNLTLTGSGSVNLNADLNVTGNVTINLGTTLNANGDNLQVSGSWTRMGTFNAVGGRVVFRGAGNQTITQTTFNDLIINKTGGVVTPGNDLTVIGDLTVNSGTLDLGTFSANRSVSGGTLSVNDGATLRVAGPSNFPTNFDNRTLGANSTVIYNGSMAQTIQPLTYGHLVLSNGGATAKTLADDIQVNGDLTISSGSTLDAGGHALSLQGSWNNNGAFTSSNGSVELSGSAKSISGSTTFNALSIPGSYTASPGTAITVNGPADLNGTLNAGTGAVTLSGDVSIDGAFTSDGLVTFTGNQSQTIQLNGTFTSPSLLNTMVFNGSVAPVFTSVSAPTFTNVIVNNSGGLTASQPWTVLGNFVVNPSGRWDGSNMDHIFRGVFTNTGVVVGSGKFTITPGAPLVSTPSTIALGSGSSFQNSGTTEFGGALLLTITGTPSSFNNVIVSNANAGGVTFSGNLNVDGDLTINPNATFHAGSGLTHSVKNNISVDGTLNGGTSLFAVGTTGPAQIGGSGNINFYDLALNGVVAATSNFEVRRNLINNATFVPGDALVSFTGSAAGAIGGSAGTTSLSNIVVNKPSSTLSLNGNVSDIKTLSVTGGTLDLGGFNVAENTGTGGSLSLAANTTLKIGSTNTLPVFTIDYALDAASTVEYNGASQNISPITYGHLALSNTGTKSFSASTPTEASNLTVNAAATLPNLATLRLNGNYTNNASFNIGSTSVIEFNGSTSQSISGSSVTDFANVTIANTAGVSVQSNQNLRGVMTLTSNAMIDADGPANTAVLSVMSSADSPTRDGAIAALPAGASVQGNVTVQRYMSIEGPGNGRIYRYISSPVQNATVADMQNEIPVSGNFTGRSVCTGCTTSASLFDYDETVITGGIDGGYVAFPVATNTETFQPGRGYAMFVRANLLTTTLWDLRGPINSGPISVPVSFTSSGTLANDGWNLAGNPYPSTIDWNATSGWTKTNVNSTIYVTDNAISSGPQYSTWNGVVGTNGGSRYIAAGQAFWVKAGSASPSLSMNESVKVAGTQTNFFREGGPENLMRITLSQAAIRDEAVIHFREDATSEFDAHADAIKLPNGGFGISTQLSGKDKLAINSLELSFCAKSVSVVLDKVAKGSYNLAFGELDSFTGSTTIQLVDNFAHTTIDPRVNNTYTFSVTDDAASLAASRFVLNFTQQSVPMDFSVSAATICKDINAPIVLSQTSNQVKYDVTVNDITVYSQPGNGGLVNIVVASDLLVTGENPVKVTATPINTCGILTQKTTTLFIEYAAQPTVNAPTVICQQGVTTLSATGATAGQQYRWYSNVDDNTPAGTGASFETPTLIKSRTFYVSIMTSSGCESMRVAVRAEVVNFTDPVIEQDGELLTVDYPRPKQWYFNSTPMTNDTTSTIRPGMPGTYSVFVSVRSCKAIASYSYIATPHSIVAGDILGAASEVKIYPNPVSDVLHFGPVESKINNVSLENSSGQNVGDFTLKSEGGSTSGKYDMSQLPAGLYFITIKYAGETKRQKVIKK
ncbi:MAG TPA: T9SS type A sorting domain-containing protein [Cyclobacteriaceae bacterium]|nr:T9SS type A sorting domain-containing protein [Cyclobacteriaceae bacterium]